MQEMKLSVDAFNQVIRKCRCKETSADPEGRSQDNPSHMHCFTTAVLLFETLGFPAYRERLVFDTGETAPHCYNKDHAGNEIRACEEQVEKYVVKKREKQALLTKDHIEFVFCMSPAIRQKHEILKQRFEKEIKTAMA